ncbi:MAG: sigma-70 family RNA polymerase sigma factor [Clostridia bacterium]|nr:sigma-70 family RNA polymerase sigma factor [Clostridia bacterium]MEE0409877.1 sigma-70 family RNA polymerase sigma factor [Clostridia bacterium]MEE0897520.1 sigma-70 family RNA polymerase sigma factor [Acutalibacteraceae bacterium]
MSIFFIEDKNGNYFSADGKRRFIRLKGKAAYDYLKSPNGRGKRFYRLSAEEETEEDVFIEIPSSKIGHIRKAERRTQYVADCKKESGRYEISLYALEANDHGERCSGEELIEDTAIDIESTAIHRIELEKLYQAVQSLSEEEQELVACLYSKNPMTVRDLSKELNIHYSTISRKHTAILRKLKRILKNL